MVDTERVIFHEAQKQMKIFALFIIVILGLMVFVANYGMKVFVTARLQKIVAFLNQIYEQEDLTKRLPLSGNDELSEVAASINLMLESITRSNKRIEGLNESLKTELGERRRTEAKLQHVSWHDGLTGLQNRAYFEAELKKINECGAKGVGVISGDIDGLKLMNDTMGHAVGDMLLQRTAEILRRVIPDTAMIARTGGDELLFCSRISMKRNCWRFARRFVPLQPRAMKTVFHCKYPSVYSIVLHVCRVKMRCIR